MLNVIRMEFYRMLKSKSFYIAGICLILTMLFSTNMSAEEWKKSTPEERQELHELFLREAKTESVAIAVTIPTEANARVTVYDLFFANIKSKLIALVFACFTVIYATADITSGYVKNIAGQIRNRKSLIYAKTLSLLVYCVGSMGFLIPIQAVCSQLFFGYVKWGPWKDFLYYLGIQTLLHYAFILTMMMLAVILKNNILTTALSIGLCINFQLIFYGFLDKFVNRMGISGWHTREYTITGNISLIGMQISAETAGHAAVVAVVFLILAVWITGIVFDLRDI